MDRLPNLNAIAFPLALLLAGCDAPGTQTPAESAHLPSNASDKLIETPDASLGSPDVATGDSGEGVNDGYPDLTPATLTPEAEQGETGARNVLLSFARAIELREWDQA